MIERKKDRLRKIQEKTHNKAKKRERNMKRERERKTTVSGVSERKKEKD